MGNRRFISFDIKLVAAGETPATVWNIKAESNGAATNAQLDLPSVPQLGVWTNYQVSLSSLADAGLDLSAIDLVMVFPAWATGIGSQYYIDNVKFVRSTDTGTDPGDNANASANAYVSFGGVQGQFDVVFNGDQWGSGVVLTPNTGDTPYADSITSAPASNWTGQGQSSSVQWATVVIESAAANGIDITPYTHFSYKVQKSSFYETKIEFQRPSGGPMTYLANERDSAGDVNGDQIVTEDLGNGWLKVTVPTPDFSDMSVIGVILKGDVADTGDIKFAEFEFTTN